MQERRGSAARLALSGAGLNRGGRSRALKSSIGAWEEQGAPEPVSVEVDGLGYSAIKVVRVEGNDRTEVWVANGVPTPVRIFQLEDGEDSTDLRLVGYTRTGQ